MERDSFVFYRSFWDGIKNAPDAEFKKAVTTLMEYALNGEEKADGFVSEMFLALTKPQIDANNARYENGKRGADAGKRGGKTKKETPNEPQTNPKETPSEPQVNPKQTPNEPQTDPKETPNTEIETPNVNANVNVNVNVNANENVNAKEEKKKEEKHKHGERGHVLLTDAELKKLRSEYPNADELIQFLDDAKEMKGYTYKSDYMAIKRWVVTAVKEDEQRVKKLQTGSMADVIKADDLPF